jgi:hypothetical protein
MNQPLNPEPLRDLLANQGSLDTLVKNFDDLVYYIGSLKDEERAALRAESFEFVWLLKETLVEVFNPSRPPL